MKILLKRDGLLAKRGLIPALCLSLLLAAVCAAAFFAALTDAGSRSAAVIALCDGEDSLLSRMAIRLVGEQPFLAENFSLEEVSEEEARAGVADGRFAAAVLLPEGFTDKIMDGEAAAGTVLLSEGAAVSAEAVRELAQLGEQLLAAGQYGVFAGQEVLLTHGLYSDFGSAYIAKSNLELLDYALDCYDSAFVLSYVPYAGTGISMTAHYALCWLSFLLFLCGGFFSGLYRSDCRRELFCRLKSLGVSSSAFLCGKILYPFLFRLFLAAGLLLLLHNGAALPVNITLSGLLLGLGGLFLLSVITSCLGIIFSEKGGLNGLLFALALPGLFLTGGLLPRSLLPQPLCALGELLPTGAAGQFFCPLFGGKCSLPSVLALLLYAAAAYAGALLFLKNIPKKGEELL